MIAIDSDDCSLTRARRRSHFKILHPRAFVQVPKPVSGLLVREEAVDDHGFTQNAHPQFATTLPAPWYIETGSASLIESGSSKRRAKSNAACHRAKLITPTAAVAAHQKVHTHAQSQWHGYCEFLVYGNWRANTRPSDGPEEPKTASKQSMKDRSPPQPPPVESNVGISKNCLRSSTTSTDCANFDEMFKLLFFYKKRHGHMHVPFEFAAPNGVKLGEWTRQMRRSYWRKQRGKKKDDDGPAMTTQKHLDMLTKLGFPWAGRPGPADSLLFPFGYNESRSAWLRRYKKASAPLCTIPAACKEPAESED